MSLRGRLPAPPQGTLPLGAVAAIADEVTSSGIDLYRQPGVRVEATSAAGLSRIERPAGDEDQPANGRWAGSFRVQGPVPADAVLRLSPNRPQVRVDQTVAIHREKETWRAEAELRLQVTGGVADDIRMEVPGSWIGPFVVDPPASLRVLDLPDRTRRKLVVYPRAAIDGQCRLRISSPMGAPTERTGVGVVAVDGAEAGDTVLVLPSQAESGPVHWEMQGLTPAPLPAEYVSPPGGGDSPAAYRVVRQPFHAAIKPADRPFGDAEVALADVSIAWQADGAWHGVAAFDLDPARLGTCTIRLAPECRLIQISVGDLPAACTLVDDHTWQVSLGGSGLPERIEVLFGGMDPGAAVSGVRQFRAPEILGLPVLETLWTVRGPRRFEGELGGDAVAADAAAVELIRLRTVTESIEQAVETADLPPLDPGVGEGGPLDEETARWYGASLRRWTASQNRLRRLLAAAPDTDGTASARGELDLLQQRQARWIERLGSGEPVAATAGASPPENPASLWRSSVDRSQPPIRLIAGRVFVPAPAGEEASPQTIAVLCRPVREGWAWGRVLGAGGLVLGAIALWIGARRGTLARAMSRRTAWAAVAAGIVWWLLLRLSVVGLLLAAVALVVWWRQSRRSRRRKLRLGTKGHLC